MSSTNLRTSTESHSGRVERKFTYKWTIHNFDCRVPTNGEMLPSVKFDFGYGLYANFTGKLSLSGDSFLKRLCSLTLESTTLDKWGVCVDLAIDSDETVNYESVSLHDNANEAVWSLKHLNKREQLMNPKFMTINCTIIYATYTVQDRSALSTKLITSDASHSYRIESQFTYKWMIKDFLCGRVTLEENLPFARLKFNFGNLAKFSGHLCLEGDECSSRQCLLELKCKTLDNWRVWIDFGFEDDMADNYGVALNESSDKAIWNLFGSWYNKCLLAKHLRNNTLTINCIITYVTYAEEKRSTYSGIRLPELYETKRNWDVILVAGGQKLYAHKVILANQSKVFTAMFEEQKSGSNEIAISDIKVDVLQDLLCFIYTGEVIRATLELLDASDKYDLQQLKLILRNQLLMEKQISEASLANLKISEVLCSYRFEKKFVYKWTIEGFDCEKVTSGDNNLPSNEFEFNFCPATKFNLALYLVGDKCRERQCMLNLKSNLNRWKVWTELVLEGDSTKSCGLALSENYNKALWSLSSLQNPCALNRCLRNNSFLTIICSITLVRYRRKKLSALPSISEIAELNEDEIIYDAGHTCHIEREFTHKWHIQDFYCHKIPFGQALPSTYFKFNFGPDAKFSANLYLDGDECQKRECILNLKSETLEKWAVRVVIGLEDESNPIEYETILSQGSNKAVWSGLSTMTGECLLTKCQRNEAVTITCQVFYTTYEQSKPATTSLDELYENKLNYDVTFVVEGHELHGRKSILAERSTVFAALFENAIDKSNKIVINNASREVFEKVLRYIYSGQVVEVTWELLAASDEYKLPQLKILCENELKSKISNENASQSLLMADACNNSELKKYLFNFIKQNLVAITKTKGWRDLIAIDHNLVAEIFIS